MQQTYSAGLGSYPPETEAGKPEETLSDRAKSGAEKLQQESRRLMDKAKEQGSSLLAERKNAVADEIGGMAEALRKASHEKQQASLITPYAERIAGGLERFSNSLRERDLASLVGQVEDFARRQPGLFIGGSVAAGFLLGRFLRSSTVHRERDYSYSSSASGGPQTSYDHGPVSGYESAAPGQAPDVIYAPPSSGAVMADLPVEDAAAIPSAGMTAAPLSGERSVPGVNVHGAEDAETGPGTAATDRAARMAFEGSEANLAAEAVDSRWADDETPSGAQSGVLPTGRAATPAEAGFTGVSSDKDKPASGAPAAGVTTTR